MTELYSACWCIFMVSEHLDLNSGILSSSFLPAATVNRHARGRASTPERINLAEEGTLKYFLQVLGAPFDPRTLPCGHVALINLSIQIFGL